MFIERGENRKEEEVKKAFDKVKNDIFSLGNELNLLKSDLFEIKAQLKLLLERKNSPSFPTDTPTYPFKNPTANVNPTDTPTVPVEARGLKYPNFDISTGNRGVPTDRQTDQQTDNPTDFPSVKEQKSVSQQIFDATEILNSLDSLKKEIRLKFKAMTNQEMLVFSTIYQLEQQFPEGVEYDLIAAKLKLSPSSIRDYTQKLISKGIPISKEKINNKKILLKITPELKRIASLDTILRLRAL